MILATSQKQSLDEIIVGRVSNVLKKGAQQNRLTLSEEAKFLNEGISGTTLKYVANVIPRKIVIQAVGSDKTNIAKLYRRKHLATWQSDGINNLSVTWLEVSNFFDQNTDDVNEWLFTPLPALEGATPESLMGTTTGRMAVSACLNRMRYGDF
jgi:uncharacterized protein (DUF2384 family)